MTKATWKVCATKARPKTASDSQIASPTHIAARKGSTSRQPLAMTRATSAAIDGPGEPAATISAPAKMSREESDMEYLAIAARCLPQPGRDVAFPRRHRPRFGHSSMLDDTLGGWWRCLET